MTTVSVITIDSLLQLVAVVEETESGYFLSRPLRVFRNFTPSNEGTIETCALVSWVPFSGDETFFIEKNKIVNISNLAEDYYFDYFKASDSTYSSAEPEDKQSEPSIDDLWDYNEAKKNNQIN